MIVNACCIKCYSKRVVWINIAAVNSQIFLVSSTFSWISSAYPKIPNITQEQLGELSSFFLYGTICGSVKSFIMLTYFGRKITLISNAILMLISWVLVIYKTEITYLYAGRFFAGLASSSVTLELPVYDAECFQPNDRQISGGVMSIYSALAHVFEYSIAPFISYEIVIFINILPIVAFLVYFPFYGAETPFHLVKTGNIKEAKEVMDMLWSQDTSQSAIDEEFEKIRMTVTEETAMGVLGAFKSIFTTKRNLKAVLLATAITSFYCMEGVIQISMDIQHIFIKAKVVQLRPEVSSAVLGCVKLIGAFSAMPLINLFGVKKTLMFTLTINAIPLICLGGYFYGQSSGCNMNYVFWLPLASLILFFMATLMGSSILPFLIRGELLPSHLRGPGGSLTDITNNVISLGINYAYLALFDDYIYWAFWMFAIITIADIVFLRFFLPETKEKTLHEIQDNIGEKN